MEAPRYRRWLGFNYLPLNLSGFLMMVAFFVIEAPVMLAAVLLGSNDIIFWLAAVIGFAVFLWFWSFIHTRTE